MKLCLGELLVNLCINARVENECQCDLGSFYDYVTKVYFKSASPSCKMHNISLGWIPRDKLQMDIRKLDFFKERFYI